jgi:hypothetical protein
LVAAPLGTNVLKLHEGLMKVKSSLTIWLRTGVNNLNAFIFQTKATSVSSPLCSCDRRWQTAKYSLIFCPRLASEQHELRDKQEHLHHFPKLLGTAE